MSVDLNQPISPLDIADGQAGHAGLHGQERQYLEALRQRLMSINPTSTTGDFGAVLLDGFTGANDDAKLADAMSKIGQDTYPRAIQLTNREYRFNVGGLVPFEGMKMMGPRGMANPERNGQTKMPCRVTLGMTGPWFTNGGGTPFQVSFFDLPLVGSGTGATFLGQSGGGTWDTLNTRGISCSGLRSLFGTQATKILLTASSIGIADIANSYSGAVHWGGSDNILFPPGESGPCLVDSGTAFAAAGGSAGQAHIWNDGMDKSYFGPAYITAEGDWRGIRHDGPADPSNGGSTNTGYVFYDGLRLEGRNPGQPCKGTLFKQNGGIAEIRSGWFGYAMSAPSSGELGVIHHAGGILDVEAVVYDPTNGGQVTGVPFVYTAGGAGKDCTVQRIKRASRGAGANAWGTNHPRVVRAAAGAENRITDASVTLATV